MTWKDIRGTLLSQVLANWLSSSMSMAGSHFSCLLSHNYAWYCTNSSFQTIQDQSSYKILISRTTANRQLKDLILLDKDLIVNVQSVSSGFSYEEQCREFSCMEESFTFDKSLDLTFELCRSLLVPKNQPNENQSNYDCLN